MRGFAKRAACWMLMAVASIGTLLPSANAVAAPCSEEQAKESCCRNDAPVDPAPMQPAEDDCPDECDALCRALCGHCHAFSPSPRNEQLGGAVVCMDVLARERPAWTAPPTLFRPPRSLT